MTREKVASSRSAYSHTGVSTTIRLPISNSCDIFLFFMFTVQCVRHMLRSNNLNVFDGKYRNMKYYVPSASQTLSVHTRTAQLDGTQTNFAYSIDSTYRLAPQRGLYYCSSPCGNCMSPKEEDISCMA